jgi:hypothetical protein
MSGSQPSKNRFCYHYKAPGVCQTPCKPIIAATSEYLSSISCSSGVISGVTQGIYLQTISKCFTQTNACNTVASTIQSTIQNSATISNQVYCQLLQVNKQRYLPYQPYQYPVVPVSVMQLQMATANVGVPMTPITCLSGKGNQTITK